MNSNSEVGLSSAPKKKPSSNTVPIRVKKSTAKTIRMILNKLNKKQLGRKVIVDDVISKSLPLLLENHLEEIKAATYSSKDRLELKHQEYCKTHGSISKEDFLEKLLQAGLPSLENDSETPDNSAEIIS